MQEFLYNDVNCFLPASSKQLQLATFVDTIIPSLLVALTSFTSSLAWFVHANTWWLEYLTNCLLSYACRHGLVRAFMILFDTCVAFSSFSCAKLTLHVWDFRVVFFLILLQIQRNAPGPFVRTTTTYGTGYNQPVTVAPPPSYPGTPYPTGQHARTSQPYQ